jgi:enoyl-[acyl-carrier protein] reductase II
LYLDFTKKFLTSLLFKTDFFMSDNRITSLFGIDFPLIQAGMVWCAGWELASAVSNSGGLGIIGSGSMYPEVLRIHIQKCKAATDKPFGVNIPLMYPQIDEHMKIVVEEGLEIVFTSAGNPAAWTSHLKEQGIKVVHVVSSVKFALKAQKAGVDAVVAEGFEAGGHNGREETTTFCLVPMVKDAVDIPVIAAGGIGDGRGMLAAMTLGADAVQIGSRFVASEESSAHQNFKNLVIEANEGDTLLTLKELAPVRLLKNKFYDNVLEAYSSGAKVDQLRELLGKGRAKKGMFEGDLDEGELEIGQISGMIREVKPAAEIVREILEDFARAQKNICKVNLLEATKSPK